MSAPAGDLDSLFCQQIASLTPSPRRWVIAHSGGLDSQVLLHLVARHLPASSLQVLHINHQLQSEANEWARFSAAQASALGITHQIAELSLDSASENSARQGRYQVFENFLQADDCLLMGQHADDQAETLLFRLLRGTGLRGLAGIPAQRKLGQGRLFRPLLGASREKLEHWAGQAGLSWVDDPSNAKDGYDRNFLRNQVMPLLTQRWPGFVDRWGQTAALMGESEQLLCEYLDEELQGLQGAQRQLYCGHLPDAAARRQALLRRWLQQQGIETDLRQLIRVEQEVIGARVDAQPQMQLGRSLIRRYQQQLFCLQADRPLPVSLEQGLAPGLFRLGDGELTIMAGPGLRTLQGIRVTRRQGGEYLRPAGRGGRCALKKLLQEAGIPPWQRENWPLLVSGEEIVAVPGVCVCENWQTKSNGFTSNWAPF